MGVAAELSNVVKALAKAGASSAATAGGSVMKGSEVAGKVMKTGAVVAGGGVAIGATVSAGSAVGAGAATAAGGGVATALAVKAMNEANEHDRIEHMPHSAPEERKLAAALNAAKSDSSAVKTLTSGLESLVTDDLFSIQEYDGYALDTGQMMGCATPSQARANRAPRSM
jgi:hypothetical protein